MIMFSWGCVETEEMGLVLVEACCEEGATRELGRNSFLRRLPWTGKRTLMLKREERVPLEVKVTI
jgi:hypothetical protein